MSSSSSSTPKSSPSQFVIDDDGRKWRRCAGCCVLNSKNQVLIGERLGKTGSWQTPQGGFDVGESAVDAAIRELYEEVGLEVGKHVIHDAEADSVINWGCKYETEGTGSWLEKEGFAGQELNWVVFRCTDSELEFNPSLVCNLSGLNGEPQEFTAVRWEGLDWIVKNVWEKKLPPYRMLCGQWLLFDMQWEDRCKKLDLSGKWARDSQRCVGVVEALVARGQSLEAANEKASEPYFQSWAIHPDWKCLEWVATTYYDAEWLKPQRELHYKIGEFEESYEQASTIFGTDGGGTVKRFCFYMAEIDADERVAHVTCTDTKIGKEEARRYIKNGEMILRRTFVPSGGTEKSVSTEVFIKC
jgi:putative (di)nucleoside polyphosphate hydrolase